MQCRPALLRFRGYPPRTFCADHHPARQRSRGRADRGEYFLTYNLPQGWFLESSATATANWEAPENDRWTLPLGGGGKVFTVGKQSLSVSAQAFYNDVTPSSASDWSLSVALQILLPE